MPRQFGPTTINDLKRRRGRSPDNYRVRDKPFSLNQGLVRNNWLPNRHLLKAISDFN